MFRNPLNHLFTNVLVPIFAFVEMLGIGIKQFDLFDKTGKQ